MGTKILHKQRFLLLALAMLIPLAAAYAQENKEASAAAEQVSITAAPSKPIGAIFGKAIGGISAIDLFYIDTADYNTDINALLYLTNAQELINNYRYLILQIGLYRKSDDGEWQKATASDGLLLPAAFLTMRNGQVSFTLSGYANYRISIDKGSYYSYGTAVDTREVSAEFYLEAE